MSSWTVINICKCGSDSSDFEILPPLLPLLRHHYSPNYSKLNNEVTQETRYVCLVKKSLKEQHSRYNLLYDTCHHDHDHFTVKLSDRDWQFNNRYADRKRSWNDKSSIIIFLSVFPNTNPSALFIRQSIDLTQYSIRTMRCGICSLAKINTYLAFA